MNPLPTQPQFKTLTVIIPAYNEKDTIQRVIESVMAVPIQLSREIIIIDDCSKDGTRDILKELKPPAGATLKVLMHDVNQGKGAAIRTGLEHVTGDIVLVQDADLEYDPADFPALLEPILSGRADVVFGNRFHGGTHRVLYFWHYQANLFLTTLCNMITNLNLSDMEVGYKVFRSEFLKKVKLTANRFGFEPEITIKAARLKCRIYEVPISYHGRTYEEGKKITWKDGVAALYFLVRFGIFG